MKPIRFGRVIDALSNSIKNKRKKNPQGLAQTQQFEQKR